jgi:hypothetical protein
MVSSLQLNVVRQQMGVCSVPASAGVETTQRGVREIYCRIVGLIALLPLLGRE